jgi:hypothetical protein
VAAIGFILAFTYLEPQGGGRARAATLSNPGQPDAVRANRPRRQLNRALVESAAGEFQSIVRVSGLPGAQVYGRQCLAQIAAQPSLPLLDYCIAFDNVAAEWERTALGAQAGPLFFADQQRFARYQSLSELVREAAVRDALMAEASYFANWDS